MREQEHQKSVIDKFRRSRLVLVGATLGSLAAFAAGCGESEDNGLYAKQTLEAKVGCDNGKAVVLDTTTDSMDIACETKQGTLKAPETFGPRSGRFVLVANENPPWQTVYVFVRKTETQKAFMDEIRVKKDRIQVELEGVEEVISAAPRAK